MKICVGIITCSKTQKRFEKFMKLHEKFFIDNNLKYYIIVADKSLIKTNVEYKIINNYFYCAVNESYETLAHKLAIFYCYIYQNTDYDYVFKFDDGCLIDQENILNLLNSLNFLKYDYSGCLLVPTSNRCHFRKCNKPILNKTPLDFNHGFDKILKNEDSVQNNIQNNDLTKITYCGGGYGYCLSRNALQHIPKYKKHILSLGLSYEDILYGQIMYLENITPVRIVYGKYHAIK